MKGKIRYNLETIVLLISVVVLCAIANFSLDKYHNYLFPEKVSERDEKIEPSWDKTLFERIVKAFIPEWQEEILAQQRIIRINSHDPKKVINAYLKISEIYEKNKKYNKAKDSCKTILKDYPKDPLRKKAYQRLVSIYEKEKNFTKVREINELIVQEFPDDSEVVNIELDLIDTYEKQGNYQKAIEEYRKFLKKYPKTKEQKRLLLKIGSLYEKQGKRQKAIEEYLKFLEKYPETEERNSLSFKIGLLYRRLGQTDKANEFYQGIKWDSDNIWGKNARAELWFSTGNGEVKKKVIYVMKISTPPTIDGYLNDLAWKKVDTVTGFVDGKENVPVTQQTFASLVYDEKNLYIAFNCLESNTSDLIIENKDHDTNVWRDDCIEVFMDTNRDYSSFLQLIVNPIGTKYDGDNGDSVSWNPKWQVATAIGENHWNVEIAISFKEIKTSTPKAGDVWGLNLTRARRVAELEVSNWSFTGGSHHQPEKFGYMVFK